MLLKDDGNAWIFFLLKGRFGSGNTPWQEKRSLLLKNDGNAWIFSLLKGRFGSGNTLTCGFINPHILITCSSLEMSCISVILKQIAR